MFWSEVYVCVSIHAIQCSVKAVRDTADIFNQQGSFVLLFSHFGTLSHALYPETAGILPLKGTLYQALLFSIGLFGLVSVEYIGSGQTDDWFKPIRESNGYSSLKPAGVEEHHAILGRCLLGLTGGGW